MRKEEDDGNSASIADIAIRRGNYVSIKVTRT